MKHIITILCLFTGISFGTSAFAQTATFDNATRYLTIPSVQVGPTIYSNVVVRLDSFAVISVGSETPVSSSVANICVAANFTTAKYNAIALGMTPDQVNQIIGCKFYTSTTVRSGLYTYMAFTWLNVTSTDIASHRIITVYFDQTGTKVTAILGTDEFKGAGGF